MKITNVKRIFKKDKTLTTIIKSFDTIVILATTLSSSKLSLKGFGLTVIRISSSIACGLSISKKVIYEYDID